MKKNSKLVLAAIALIVMAFLMTACQSKAPEAKPEAKSESGIVGDWTSEKLGESYVSMGLGDLLGNDPSKIALRFAADGTMTTVVGGKDLVTLMTESMKQANLTEDAIKQAVSAQPVMTYKVEGDQMTISTKIGDMEPTSVTNSFKLEGDNLTVNYMGQEVSLTRVK